MPGFNDTNRRDIETLGVLAAYLGASYANGVRIHGLIVLHPISDNRMTGSGLRNINMLKAMCNFTCYNNVAIATTMWPQSPQYAEKTSLEHREATLLADDRFFGDLIDRGATLFRHNEHGLKSAVEAAASARRIVAHLIHQSDIRPPDVLQIQREMVDERKALGETAAGIAADGELDRARRAHEMHLQELEEELRGQLAKRDASHAAELQELRAEVINRLEKVEEEKQALKKSMEDLHGEEERVWKQRIRELDDMFRQQLIQKQQELADMKHSLDAIHKDMARQAWTLRQRAQAAIQAIDHASMLGKAQEEISKVQEASKKFKAHTGNIVNGSTNGLAAGITSGLIGKTCSFLCHSRI